MTVNNTEILPVPVPLYNLKQKETVDDVVNLNLKGFLLTYQL